MHKKWTKMSIGEFCQLNYGKNLPKETRKPLGNIPVYGSNGMIDYNSIAFVNRSGIIIGRKGSIGKIHFSKSPFWPIDTTFYIEENESYCIKFIYYLLNTLKLNEMNSDTAVPGLNRNAVHNISVYIPPLQEQKAIAEILGALDDKIELNRQMNTTLKDMAQTLFKSWFVDFDPVHAKAQGQKPQVMSDEIAALFPSRFIESELGMIPNGWKVSKLGDYINFIKGKKPLVSSELPQAPHLLIAAFDGLAIEMVSTEKMVMAEPDDILMVMDGASSGRTEIGFCGVVGSTIAKITAPIELKLFVYNFLKRNESEINAQTTGTSIPHTDKNLIYSLSLCLPPIKILHAFNNYAKNIQKKISHNKQECSSLSALRDTLLPKLLSGEISVKAAEKQISQAI